ncbi:MAG: hypothetical protein QXH51_06160 [Candidatus Bathyarchaeia archaeon]
MWKFKGRLSFINDILFIVVRDQTFMVEPENDEERTLIRRLREELEKGNEYLDASFLPLIERIGKEFFEEV